MIVVVGLMATRSETEQMARTRKAEKAVETPQRGRRYRDTRALDRRATAQLARDYKAPE